MVDWNPFSDKSWEDDNIWGGERIKIPKKATPGGLPPELAAATLPPGTPGAAPLSSAQAVPPLPSAETPAAPGSPKAPEAPKSQEPEPQPILHGFSRGKPAFMDIPKGVEIPPMPFEEAKKPAIPFVDAPEAALPKPKPPPPPKGVRRILIIDDNLMIRRNYKVFLEKLGFEVVEAVDGKNGLDKMSHYGLETISLVMVDLNMPVMNGEEFVSAAKESFKELLPPVWVCTVSAEAPVVKSLAAKGISGYLVKPVQFKAFAGRLQALFPDMDIQIPS